MKQPKQAGFTLIELMVTVAVIAILAAIAFPSYQDSLRKSRRTDGKNALTQAAANMERLYSENNAYCTSNCTTINMCNSTPRICPDNGTCSGAGVCTTIDGYYTIDFVGDPTRTTFLLNAVPGGAQAIDGKMTIDYQGKKQYDANNDGDYVDAGEDNWK